MKVPPMSERQRRRAFWLLAAAVAVLVAVAVFVQHGTGPAGRGDTPGVSPDGYIVVDVGGSEVRSACDGHGHRVYVLETYQRPAVAVIDDPACVAGVEASP